MTSHRNDRGISILPICPWCYAVNVNGECDRLRAGLHEDRQTAYAPDRI